MIQGVTYPPIPFQKAGGTYRSTDDQQFSVRREQSCFHILLSKSQREISQTITGMIRVGTLRRNCDLQFSLGFILCRLGIALGQIQNSGAGNERMLCRSMAVASRIGLTGLQNDIILFHRLYFVISNRKGSSPAAASFSNSRPAQATSSIPVPMIWA